MVNADEDTEGNEVNHYETEANHEEEDESDESDEGDEGDEGAEEEPKLKYQRLSNEQNDIEAILQNDSARVLLPHDKFLVLGTRRGYVHILDLTGNAIMQLRPHLSTINDMSLDADGEYLASCSDDGTVVITDIWSEGGKKSKHAYHMPVKAVALPANYKESQKFATGGFNQQFVINTKSRVWFTNRDNVIHSGEGPIYAIEWRKSLLAWANNFGVKFYDTDANEPLMVCIKRGQRGDPASNRCCLCWSSDNTLIIGWGDSVKIAMVKWRTGMTGAGGGAADRFVQIMSMFQIESGIVSGVAPFGNAIAVLLSYDVDALQDDDDEDDEKNDNDDDNKFFKPELRIMSWAADELSTDALPMHGYQYYKPSDYRMTYSQGSDPIYYIVSPKDIVMARPYDVDDHIRWLESRGRYAEALKSARENEHLLKKTNLLTVGSTYLAALMDQNRFDEAAAICPNLLKDAKMWTHWLSEFAKNNQMQAIAPYVPVTKPQLDQTWYETVLGYLVNKGQEWLHKLVVSWPPHIYNAENVINRIVSHLDEQKHLVSPLRKKTGRGRESERVRVIPGERPLLEALCHLYKQLNQYSKAVRVYLRLGNEDVFDMLKTPALFDVVKDRAVILMSFRPHKAIELYLEHMETIHERAGQEGLVDDVVSQLRSEPRLLHLYLDALFKKDSSLGRKHHDKQIALYTEFDPKSLLGFLRTSNRYNLENALNICQKKKMYPEMVHILEKMGDLKTALKLIIDQLKDVRRAIEFVEENEDEGLWEDLINQTLHHPEYLSDLLEDVGSHVVDMPKLIRQIPNEMEIPHLRDKVRKILADQMLQVSLRTGCNQILVSDNRQLQSKLYKQSQTAVKISATNTCGICECALFGSRRKREPLVVFNCNHSYHKACLVSMNRKKSRRGGKLVCLRCNSNIKDRRQGFGDAGTR